MPDADEGQAPSVVDNGLIVAALLATVTDWNKVEIRNGRRGEYRTTGASMYRIRSFEPEETEQLRSILGILGIDADEEDLADMFSGAFEYQVSYACNRFATKAGGEGRTRLTSNETRTLERARSIINAKPEGLRVISDEREKRAA